MKKLLPLLAVLVLLPLPAWADYPEFALIIRDHRFEPAEIRIPAGQKIKLVVAQPGQNAGGIREL